MGDSLPEKGLGRDWTNHFIMKHHNRLGMHWPTAFDESYGCAVNSATKEEYFIILKEVREKYNILDESIYSTDETGIQSGIGAMEQVIGPAGA